MNRNSEGLDSRKVLREARSEGSWEWLVSLPSLVCQLDLLFPGPESIFREPFPQTQNPLSSSPLNDLTVGVIELAQTLSIDGSWTLPVDSEYDVISSVGHGGLLESVCRIPRMKRFPPRFSVR